MVRKNKNILGCLTFAGLISGWLALGLFFLPLTLARATTLSDLIASMPNDSWATVTPSNTGVIGGGLTTSYADSGAWDPINKKFLFLGSDHSSPYDFVIWDDTTSSWTSGPALPGVPKSTIFVGHAYDGNTSDGNGNFYYRCRRTYCGHDVFKYNVTTNSWSTLPDNTAETNENGSCCMGIAYFPEMGGLIWVAGSGQVWFFSDSTQSWSLIGTAPTGGFGTWAFVEYNPVRKIVLFGSGSNNQLFKLTQTGTITQLKNIPYTIYDGSGFAGQVSVDPVSGLFIVLTASAHECKTYEVNTDTWGTCKNPPTSLQNVALAAAPVSNYGATIFLNCGSMTGRCIGDLYVYKHSAGGTTPPPPTDTTAPSSPANLSSTGASSSQINVSWSASTDDIGVTGYRVERCQGAGCTNFTQVATPSTNSYSDTGLSANTTYSHRVRAIDAAGNLSPYSAIVSAITQSTTTPPASTGSRTLLVKFGKTSSLNSFGLSGWSTAIKDVYTDYQDIGPGGTSIVVGNNSTYNYQGVNGTIRSFVSGEKISVTWYNNSSTALTFTPNISFTDPDRISSGSTGTWYSMTQTAVPAFGSATSEYAFTSSSAGSYSLVNLNVNYTNTQVIVADKIELLPIGSSSSSFDFSLSNGGNKSVNPGSSISSTLMASLLAGTSQVATFAVAGLPSGSTGIFSSSSCAPTCSTTLTISTQSTTPAGNYTITVTSVAGSITKTSAFTLTVSSVTTPPPSTGADADFLARCSAPGVVKCQGFNTMGAYGSADLVRYDVDPAHANVLPRADGQFRGTVDTSIKKSGGGSLRFQLDAGYAQANIAGQYLPQTNDGLGSGFGQNSDMYVQYAVRFSPEMQSNLAFWNSSWKISIFHMNQTSCGGKELTANHRGNDLPYIMAYKDCGGAAMYTDVDGSTWKTQNPPYLYHQGDYSCAYPNSGNCWTYPTDKWITLYFHVHNGTWAQPGSSFEAWYSVDGQPYVKWLNVLNNFSINCNAGNGICPTEVFNNLTLTPYMTSLSVPAPVNAYVWYDELIVSAQPIAAPGAAQSGTPPSPPTNLSIQ